MKCFSSFLDVNVQQIQGMQEHDWGGEEKEHDEQASVDADGSCPPLPVRDRKVLPGEIVQQSPLTQHKIPCLYNIRNCTESQIQLNSCGNISLTLDPHKKIKKQRTWYSQTNFSTSSLMKRFQVYQKFWWVAHVVFTHMIAQYLTILVNEHEMKRELQQHNLLIYIF